MSMTHNDKPDRTVVRTLFALAVGLVLLFLFANAFGGEEDDLFICESGIVETATAIGYFLCIPAMLLQGGLRHLKQHFYIYLSILGMAFRELDFHTMFTTMGVLKTRYYLSPEVPGMEKLIAGTLVLLFMACLGLTVVKHVRTWFSALRAGGPRAISVAFVVGLALFSKSIDGLSRKLHVFSIEMTEAAARSGTFMEEIAELGIPLFMLAAILIYFAQQRAARTATTPA
ncbi:MAG: hypothetical protein HQ523_09540 [Lentisphaerae bacterium]|nr:hypothetical protein [Lentisphaerota bacterium]